MDAQILRTPVEIAFVDGSPSVPYNCAQATGRHERHSHHHHHHHHRRDSIAIGIRDHYPVKPHDPVILMSDTSGDTWRIALTKDFAAEVAR